MAETMVVEGLEQRLGRRLGLEPYYRVAEQGPGRLRLASRPELNRPTGLAVVGIGAVLLLVAVLIAVSGLISAGSGTGFTVAALAAVLGGLLGGLGYQRIVGGYAILTTRNQIDFDAGAATISFEQGSRVGKPRRQVLPFARISGLRLRRRPLAVGWLRQVRPIVALELIAGAHVWIVDSAAEAAALHDIATAVATVLGREFETTGG